MPPKKLVSVPSSITITNPLAGVKSKLITEKVTVTSTPKLSDPKVRKRKSGASKGKKKIQKINENATISGSNDQITDDEIIESQEDSPITDTPEGNSVIKDFPEGIPESNSITSVSNSILATNEFLNPSSEYNNRMLALESKIKIS